ncbi:hypothetical protein [Tateyamaria sp. syn59]|uniref:hypothetical protein n=1 Tax=Tateyamaria sp. syn59 TaxID=2576942 RepID=UPI0011BF7120|nr:hypothetical protein [Tateyamaria sp. syn59]
MDLGLQGTGALVMSSYSHGRGFGIAEGLVSDGCRNPAREPVHVATFLASYVTSSLIRCDGGAVCAV